jgi:benzoate membrane transport protein
MAELSPSGRVIFPPLAAGLVAVLVGYTSSVALIFQAGLAAGASIEIIGAWLGALSVGMGLCTIGLSLRYKQPVMIAWSTPGAALLATSLVGVPLPQAIGAFVVTGVLIAIAGATGWFERLMNRLPMALASAMLAGVLARFALDAVLGVQAETVLVLWMFAVYLAAKRFSPRYTVIWVLVLGLAAALLMGRVDLAVFAQPLQHFIAQPHWITPEFSWSTIISVALPLFVVTMASQNVPGVAAIRAGGYETPISPVIATTGVVTALLAPFGAYALNLAAITAAICMGPEAHPDKNKRYWAAVACGTIYLVVAFFGAAVALLLAALPKALVLALAGLALLGTMGNGMAAAVREESTREAALVTFLVTLSGVSLLSIGAAFWGIVAGTITLLVLKRS